MIKIRGGNAPLARGVSMPNSEEEVLRCVQSLVGAVCLLLDRIQELESRIAALETIGQTGGTRIK